MSAATQQLRALLPLSIDCPLLLLLSSCASAIYVGIGSIPVNVGRTCLQAGYASPLIS